MKKKTRATSIVGAALFFTGLAVIVVVAMMILVPPSIPEDYAQERDEIVEPPLFSQLDLVDRAGVSLVGEAQVIADDSQESTTATTPKNSVRNIPAPNSLVPHDASMASPAQQQSAQGRCKLFH